MLPFCAIVNGMENLRFDKESYMKFSYTMTYNGVNLSMFSTHILKNVILLIR